MMSCSRKNFEVYDFKEDDEETEATAKRFMGKFRNPNSETSPSIKYHFLQAFSRGVNAQGKGISDISCVDVDASDSNHKCKDRGSHTLGTLQRGICTIKEGISGSDEILVSNSISQGEQSHANPVSIERENLLPGCNPLSIGCWSVNPLATGASSLGVPSSMNEQMNCNQLGKPPKNDPVDVISDDEESTTYSSDIREDQGSVEGSVSDHYTCDWEMENTHMTVVVSPDYLIYKDIYCTESSLIFSCRCIKFEGINAYGSKDFVSFEWGIDDVIGIESQWYARVETALVKLCIRPAAYVVAEIADGTSGILELKFAVCDPYWSDNQEKIMSMDAKYRAIWKVLLDTDAKEEDDFVGKNQICHSKRYYPTFDEPFEDVVYPKGDPDAVSISKRDVELLQPETFINDTIIDFYIKYLKNKIRAVDRHRFHFFNSFFFRKLADLDKDPSSASEGRAAFLRVRKWTRKVNLFEKDYVFIPVNFNLHWSLIVICHPGEIVTFRDREVDKSRKVPCILHMDSIKGSHKGLKNLVQSYMWEEWKERQQESSEGVSSNFFNLRFVPLELPQQENSFDCGLFLLHYVELFLDEAPLYFNPFKITKFSNFLNLDWFPPAEASLKRSFIQNLIYGLLEDHPQKTSPAACDNDCHSFQSMENNCVKENGVEFLSEVQSPTKACNGYSSCPNDDQGIEIKLLSTPGEDQFIRDSGLVLRELFEPGSSAGSFSNGQFRSFDQLATSHKFKAVMTPIKEEEETGEQFAFTPSGRHLAGITVGDACTTSHASKVFGIFDTLSNFGSSMGQDEADDSLSSEASGFGSQNSSEVKVDEHLTMRGLGCPNRQEETEKSRLVSPENIESLTGSPASVCSEGMDTDVVQDSQEMVAECEERRDSLSSCQENLPDLSHPQADLGENENPLGEDVQSSDDMDASESDEQRAAKRARLMLPVEGERQLTGSVTKDCHS